jgi:anaphase-promoting complex subunit 1
MWDAMTPSSQFVLAQIPELIRFIYENPLNKVYERYYLVYNVSEIDYQTITTIYLSVITGAIMALSLRYAGTGSQAVVRIIRDHIEHLKGVKITKCEFANDPLNKNSIDQYELFSLLSSSILALSIVMAGSCDIESLKLVRVIRKKFQDSKVFHYGFSMAVNMSIGFIFLGYGNYTFNREDMSIAALLIATFPQFPNAPGDNRWHLQALRHFYVLAMEEKIFHSVDVDANKVVNVAARMTFFAEGEYQS